MQKQIVSLFLITLAHFAAGQNIEKVIADHLEAIGQKELLTIRSLSMEVREIDGFGGGRQYTIIKKAPNKIRIEGKWQDQIYVHAFDGHRCWTISPWTGVLTPQLMTASEQQMLLLQANLGSPLYLGVNSDVQLSLKASINILGNAHHVVRLTYLSGFYVDFLIDKKTDLIYSRRLYDEEGAQMKEEMIFKNYKNIGRVCMPFGYEIRGGRKGSDIIIDDIVLGMGVSNSVFTMPAE